MPQRIAILHYSAPSVVGGVETVIQAHAQLLTQAGHQVTVIAGRGEKQALPDGTGFELIPEMDSQHPAILKASVELEKGRVPVDFEPLTNRLETALGAVLEPFDDVIVHNIFTKHFNMPLTSALTRILEKKGEQSWIAWCHDFSWTSPHSRFKVHPGTPWDALRTYLPDVTYVTVSRTRQGELAGLLGVAEEKIKVVYNGVDPAGLLGLSKKGNLIINGLGIWESDLVMLMPVRITQAKNIETALKVTAALTKKGLHPTLVITGPPDPHDPSNMDYYQGLQDLRNQLRVGKEVRFVFDGVPGMDGPLILDSNTVSELYRVSDLLFLPSHREGFGMPVLEAGLIGLPVICAKIPAAEEIGGQDVMTFSPEDSSEKIAELIMTWINKNSQFNLRKRVRAEYTWQAIFEHQVSPLLGAKEAR